VSSTPTIARTGNHQFGAIQGLQPQAGRAQTSDPLQAAMESEVATTVIGNNQLLTKLIEYAVSRLPAA